VPYGQRERREQEVRSHGTNVLAHLEEALEPVVLLKLMDFTDSQAHEGARGTYGQASTDLASHIVLIAC
jgi:hypothetical protein